MENLLPDYSLWRKKYKRTTGISYLIVLVMEFVIFFVLKKNNLILEDMPEYLLTYFVTPMGWISLAIIVAMIVDKKTDNERVKNGAFVLAYTCMVGVVAIVHNIFFVTLLLFCIPIAMTIVFGDKLLLYVTSAMSTIFVICVVIYCYTVTLISRQNEYFIPAVIIALVGIWGCTWIASMLIDLLNEQNRKLIKAVEDANYANDSKSAFLSNMSHDIRTPMNAIVGITDIMLRTEKEPVNEKYLLNIKHSGVALLGIINDILDFSKIESGKMTLVDDTYSLYEMLDDLSLIFWNRIEDKNIELVYDIDKDVPDYIYGDHIRVRQVIINIVNNAIKFTDEGFVKLAIRARQNKNDIELLISVSDSGQGIKEENMPRLFSSYEQLNTNKNHGKEGTGLGLAISKQLINMMGGDISVESEYGKGTTFSFNIHQRVDAKTASYDYSKVADELKGRRIAVAINSDLVRKSIEEFLDLTNAEYEIIAADTERTKEYDIAFTDAKKMQDINAADKYIIVNPYAYDIDMSLENIISKPVYAMNLYTAVFNKNKQKTNKHTKKQKVTFEGKRVLLVDDNKVNMKVAQLLFKPLLMDIDTAENGKEALEKVENNRYDLVFMDHMMPVMDGVESTMAIRKLGGEYYSRLPIVALTANAVSEVKDELLAAGMNDIITKPISMDNIIEVLQKWLG